MNKIKHHVQTIVKHFVCSATNGCALRVAVTHARLTKETSGELLGADQGRASQNQPARSHGALQKLPVHDAPRNAVVIVRFVNITGKSCARLGHTQRRCVWEKNG